MLLVILFSIIILVLLMLYILKDVEIKNKGSLIGLIYKNIIAFVTFLFRNRQIKLINGYKKINNLTKWDIIEGNFGKYTVKKLDINGLAASVINPKFTDNNMVILQLHGGGYELDLPNNSLYFAPKYFKKLQNIKIITINYRVAPKYPFPAALEDSVKAYKYLLEIGHLPKEIIIVGDSAGGGLAIATVLYLKDNKIPLPNSIITMSAWTNLTNTELSIKEKYTTDPVFGNSNQSIIFTSRYAGQNDKKNPYISPMYGNFTDFPDMLMQVGSEEMLLDDSINLAKKAKKQGVNVELSVYNGMFHIFQKHSNFLKESRTAWNEVYQFISKRIIKK